MASFISPICHSPEKDYWRTPMARWQFQRCILLLICFAPVSQPRWRIDLSKCSQSPLHAYIEARQRQQMCASAHLLWLCSAVHPHQVSQHTKGLLVQIFLSPYVGPALLILQRP